MNYKDLIDPLTKKGPEGRVSMNCFNCPKLGAGGDPGDGESLCYEDCYTVAVERLAEYEELGMTPSAISKLVAEHRKAEALIAHLSEDDFRVCTTCAYVNVPWLDTRCDNCLDDDRCNWELWSQEAEDAAIIEDGETDD